MSLGQIIGTSRPKEEGTHWLTVSDLMAGLMMIFLFIAISFMRYIQIERDQIKDIVVIANDTQLAIYEALEEEFSEDLKRWNAELDQRTLTVRFKEPDILFARSSADLKPEFKTILTEFFPRYIARLTPFKDSIAEIRIEGHTSSEWSNGVTNDDAYFLNMDLSQRRTRSVLEYCYLLPGIVTFDWLKERIAAVGLSSSRLIRQVDGSEDQARSRRVEFSIVTNFERRIIQTIVGQRK